MRQCKVCGKTKRISAFSLVNVKTKPEVFKARRRECRVCYKARHRKYYAENPESYKGRIRLDRVERRLELIAGYGGKCVCCGESNALMLAVDHVNNDGAKHRRESAHHGRGPAYYRWLIEQKFPKEFQLLCHNCNRAKWLNGGVCPHKEGSTTIPKGSRAKRPEVPSPRER